MKIYCARELWEELGTSLDDRAEILYDSHDSADLILIEAKIFLEKQREIPERKCIIFSSESDEWNVLNIVGKTQVMHLISLKSDLVEHEINQVINSFEAQELEYNRLFKTSIESKVLKIKNKDNFQDEIKDIIFNSPFEDFFDSPKDYLLLMANELITNGLKMSKGLREIEFSLTIGTEFIGLRVSDQIGQLQSHVLREFLYRGFKEKTYIDKERGAGLGFYFIFNYANQLIFNLHNASKTEIIILIDKNKRLKAYKNRTTSLHIYEQGFTHE
jgi:hypothetical protein